jgi:DNA replication ATP-dependent helicase Dna2
MSDYRPLLQRLDRFIRSESENRRGELERQWARPLAERVAYGRAIEGLHIDEIRKDGILLLSCVTNDSRFREGDFLVLHQGDPRGEGAVECLLEYDDETQLEVSFRKGDMFCLRDQPDRWIADESMLDLSPFYLDALDQVAETRRGRETILPLLCGEKTLGLDYARYERSKEEALKNGLDEDQAEAVAQAYAADLLHLIQGPPGTGKTLVLAHLARQLVADGRRVLVTGLTHRAINNALNKVVKVDSGLPVCKVGIETRAVDLLAPNYANFVDSGFGDLPGGYIVGATPFATRSERLSGIEFDVILFDEASQITLPLAIMGMLAGSKYVFIGDEHQLPPVTTSRTSKFGAISIFSYLNGCGSLTMLSTTYRMNDVLTAWPSRTFYEGRIRPAPGIAGRRLKLNLQGTRWDLVLDPEQPAVFLDLLHRNSTTRSQLEADVVCELVRALIHHGLPPAEIGVVVPYRAQGRLIRNGLHESLPTREMLKDLAVDTVERMQGQEREAVLVSLTTSSPTFARQLADFFFQPERMNVAVTRARTKLILVGSHHVLDITPEETEVDEWVQLLRDLMSACATLTLPEGRPT